MLVYLPVVVILKMRVKRAIKNAPHPCKDEKRRFEISLSWYHPDLDYLLNPKGIASRQSLLPDTVLPSSLIDQKIK